MSGFLQKGTRIQNLPDLLTVEVAITSGVTSVAMTADPRLIGGRVVSCELFPATDIAKLNAIPTISASGVLTVTTGSSTSVISTGYVTVALKTGNNV